MLQLRTLLQAASTSDGPTALLESCIPRITSAGINALRVLTDILKELTKAPSSLSEPAEEYAGSICQLGNRAMVSALPAATRSARDFS